MKTNLTKQRLKNGETVFGCFIRYADAGLVELIGHHGWDFFVFDGEHGTLDPASTEHMVRAAELTQVTPLIRATTNSAPVILRFLDTGAAGVHVPWVNSAAEVEAVVQAVKYHPRGVRGLAGTRAADYGQSMPLAEYIEFANEQTMVIVHIETIAAVDNIEAIAAVDGVDVVFIGPTDLSHSMGLTGQLDHPEVTAAMDRVVEIVNTAEPVLGIYVSNPQAALDWKAKGARYLTTGLESLLPRMSRDFLDSVREV